MLRTLSVRARLHSYWRYRLVTSWGAPLCLLVVVLLACCWKHSDAQSATVPLTRVFPNLSFTNLVQIVYSSDYDRWYAVQQAGLIATFPNNPAVQSSDVQTFLDIRSLVQTSASDEQGLLGLALDPNFASNRRFFVTYTSGSSSYSLNIARFTASSPTAASPSTQLVILSIPHPYANHNGGWLAFNPGENHILYVGTGDGGSEGDPLHMGQDTSVLLGKMLRLDVSASSTSSPYRVPPDNPFVSNHAFLPEIWAYGLRNPWRCSFDSVPPYNLWCGDVGQDKWEEIDLVQAGGNYGWSMSEGFNYYPPNGTRSNFGIMPKFAYPHNPSDCSQGSPFLDCTSVVGYCVIGGVVYRGTAVPSLSGKYIYADYLSQGLYAMDTGSSRVTHIATTSSRVAGFGVDGNKEVYLVGLDGTIYRVGNAAPVSPTPSASPNPNPSSPPTIGPTISPIINPPGPVSPTQTPGPAPGDNVSSAAALRPAFLRRMLSL